MIEAPPVLTIRRDFLRPSADQIEELKNYSTCVIADCLGGRGALGPEIQAIDPRTVSFSACAITCHAGPADNLGVFAAMNIAKAGDAIVIATDGYTQTAVIGDMVLGMGKNAGLQAMVTDGCVRDVEGIIETGMACFAAGISPNSPACSGPGNAGFDITLAGNSVACGDIIVGDRNGVVVVPFAEIDKVLSNAAQVHKAEVDLEAAMRFIEFDPAYQSACLKMFDLNCPKYFACNERDNYLNYLSGKPEGYELLQLDSLNRGHRVLVLVK